MLAYCKRLRTFPDAPPAGGQDGGGEAGEDRDHDEDDQR